LTGALPPGAGAVALTPEQLQRAREQLPPFGDNAAPSPELQAFCQSYGLYFTALMPQVAYQAGQLRSGEFTLAVHQWRQPDARANLLLVHGYFDHSGLFNKLIAWALAHRCNVLIFDLPGHGLSSGEPAVIDDFGNYSRAIDTVLRATSLPALPWWVMAQSTGGAALIDYARKYAWPFAATVLLAPLVRPARWASVSAAHRLLAPFVPSVERKFAANSSDREFLDFLKRDPLQSRRTSLRWVGALRRWLRELPRRDLGVGAVLVIQGDADATVDWRYNVGFVSALFPGSRVEYLPGAGHQLANESESYRRAYLASVVAWLGQCGIALDDA
jgi:alpha-beta hydrolase superfamily lysophospholipase